MAIGLFTSRVVLNVLGINDYGTYNVVGGVVTMFSVITGSMSQAISRYLTFELGKCDKSRLQTIFCTSVNITDINVCHCSYSNGNGWYLVS